MSLNGFSIFSFGGHFVQRSKTILAIFEKLHQGIIPMNYFEIGPLALEKMSFYEFFYF